MTSEETKESPLVLPPDVDINKSAHFGSMFGAELGKEKLEFHDYAGLEQSKRRKR